MSKVLVVNECHLQRTPDGKCWSKGIVDYGVFRRYLSAFEEVLVAIRVTDVHEKDANYVHLCIGDGVKVLPIPDFSGVGAFLKNYFKITAIMRQYCEMADCAIIRTPSAISFQFLDIIDGMKPYAVEVSGDPWFWMAPGEYRSRVRPIIRISWTRLLKKYCMKANGAAYVTKEALQKRYPCRAIKDGESERYFTGYYSTVSIDGDNKYGPKTYGHKDSYRLIHVANAFTTYSKGHKECIDVIKALNDSHEYLVKIDFIGEGPLQAEFEQYARERGVAENVTFKGRLNNKEEVWKALRKADLFLFPTHSEGLPRVVIESMYVGTPVVSTDIGGIPELIDAECISAVGDTERMISIVERLLDSSEEMTALSKKGVERVSEYMEDVLQNRRMCFCNKLKDLC